LHAPLSFLAIRDRGAAIRGERSGIPAGLVGAVRRSVAGSRFEVDHAHPDLELDLVVRGSGSIVLEEHAYVLKPGTLIWLLPGQRHRLVRTPKLEMWVVTVRPDLLGADALPALAHERFKQLPGEELIDLDRLLGQVAQDSDEPALYNAGVTYVAMRAYRAARASPPAHQRPMHPAVTRALLLLRENDQVSLPGLAREAGTTASYLSRLLVEQTGQSFVAWRNRTRLDAFMRAYRPGANLLHAALDAGFGSYARFHHIFHALVGCTPSDWVRNAGERPPAPAAEMPAAVPEGYGVPGADTLSARQRWTGLVPLVGPAVHALLGASFLDRLAAADPHGPGAVPAPYDGLDASLPPGERERLLTPLLRANPAVADDLGRLIEVHDFPGTFARILDAFGMSPTRLADAATAMTVLVWVAANRAGGPSVAEVAAVDRQVQAALGGSFARLDRRAAQDAHSALLCQFVVAYHALEAARASGSARAVAQLCDAAAYYGWEAFGGDMTRVALTASGLVPRGRPQPARRPDAAAAAAAAAARSR